MTRYPKSGKGSKWTIKELNAVKPEWKGDTLSDGEGLSGEIRFSGSVSIHFRYAFKWADKVAWHYCGAYPANDMTAIRDERNKARELVKGRPTYSRSLFARHRSGYLVVTGLRKNDDLKWIDLP